MFPKKDEKGISIVISAAILLSVLGLAYAAYSAYGVPGYCKEAESRMISQFLDSIVALSAAQNEVIGRGVSSSAKISTQYPYPSIPLFYTPDYASVATGTYDLTVRISNIRGIDVNIPSTITLNGKGVWLSLQTVFTTPITAYIEAGIVATDGAYIGGSVFSQEQIYVPLFHGDSVEHTLYSASGGGRGIMISNATQGNITIAIIGTKIPLKVWDAYSKATNLRIDTSRYPEITIHVPPGTYVLKSGLSSFVSGNVPLEASYLLAETATSQKIPAALTVTVLDSYFNPTVGTVTFQCLQSCPVSVRAPICSGSSCSIQSMTLGSYSATGKTVSVVADQISGQVALVVASINRSAGGPYQVPFLIAG